MDNHDDDEDDVRNACNVDIFRVNQCMLRLKRIIILPVGIYIGFGPELLRLGELELALSA